MICEPLPSYEVLTVEELAQRLRVSRATLFTWMQKGVLSQGRHYFKRGRVLRFIWNADLINELLLGKNDCQEQKPVLPVTRIKSESPLNWDY